MNLRPAPILGQAAVIRCILATGEVSARMAALPPSPTPFLQAPQPAVQADPRPRSKAQIMAAYGLTEEEIPAWREIVAKRFGTLEAADIIIRSRRPGVA